MDERIAIAAMIISFSAMALAQVIKFVTWSIKSKKFFVRALISTGGWPSSHCALVTALAFSTLALLDYKINLFFALAIVVSIIIVHDAMGVRLEASKHAEILNDINEELSEKGLVQLRKKPLKERLGHEPFEVLGGIILGVAVALVGCLIFQATN